jgi:tetratricopeptide (TPR) repeat protein/predicted Ser/Thr protein kinase
MAASVQSGAASDEMPGSTSTDQDATAVVDASDLSSSELAGSFGTPKVGARLGRYLVIEEVGRGGMGLVLRAYDPKLQREVALKIVRTDTLDDSAQSRLVREARAMAQLSHPNVVAVYDVELEEGVVLVMEYVPGTTLGKWLEQAPRSRREVVDALVAAGRGLGAAHAEGLLHRDFKLDNVLVGNDGRVRVTDFGLARATGVRASLENSDASSESWPRSPDGVRSEDGVSVELTAAGTVMGTPPYMAPEQSECGELDTRTDQYAFCVTLWRALTGRWPFEDHGPALLEAKRAGAPRWPSDVATPWHIVAALRRGLAPDPLERWPSVPALLAELGRDPGRRRRSMLSAGVLALAAIGVWGTQHVQRERALAACASEAVAIDEVWNDGRAEAIAAAFEATGISYAADTWSRSRARLDSYAQQWRSTRRTTCERAEVEHTLTRDLAPASRACLDEHRDRLDALLQQLEQPDATVVQRAGTATASLPLVRACTDENRLRHRAEPPSDPDVRAQLQSLRSRLSQASAASVTGRFGLALEHAQAVLREATALSWAPLSTEAKVAVAGAHDNLGHYEDARAGYEEAFFEAAASARDELALRASSRMVLTVGHRLARHDEGLQWGRLSQMLVDRLGLSDDLAVAELLNELGGLYIVTGAYEDAKAVQERALVIREKTLGPDHPHVAVSLNNLANAHYATGAYEDARAKYERALAIQEKALGPDHPDAAATLNNLGGVHYARGAYDDMKAVLERALTINEKALGPDHPDVAVGLSNLAHVHQDTGAYDDAKALYERALAIREQALGPEHPAVAGSLNNLGTVHYATSAYDDAKALHEQALAIQEKALGPDHSDLATTLNNLADVHRATGAYDDAKAMYERSLAIREQALGPDHPRLAYALIGLGEVALHRRRAAEAVPLAERARTLRETADVSATDIAEARFLIARAMADAGKSRVEAAALAEQALHAYQAAGDATREELTEVERWLATHGE